MILYDPIVDEPKKPVFLRDGVLKTDRLVVSSFFEMDHRLVMKVVCDLLQKHTGMFTQVSSDKPVTYEFDRNNYNLLVNHAMFYDFMVEVVDRKLKYNHFGDYEVFDLCLAATQDWEKANTEMLNLFDAVLESKDHTKDE